MTEQQAFTLLVGQLTPVIIGYIANYIPKKPYIFDISNSFVVAVLTSATIGLGTVYYSGAYDSSSFVILMALV